MARALQMRGREMAAIQMPLNDSVKRMADPIGFDIGMDGSDTQAALLNGFARAFIRSMPNRLDRERQMAYVVEDMTPEARGVFVNLGTMCEPDEN